MSEPAFDFMKIWSQSDEESEFRMKTVLLDGLDSTVRGPCDVLSRIKVGKPVANPVVRWVEEHGYPSTITAQLTGNTLVFSGYLFGRMIDEDSVIKVIREGAILERQRGGCQVKVSSTDGLSAVVGAYGNTVLDDDPLPAEWDIISEAWSDYRDASSSRFLDRTLREVGTQIFAETFEIPKTRKNTKYHMVSREAEHQIVSAIRKLRRQLAYAILRSRPSHDGSQCIWGNKTQEPTLCGLCTWPIVTQSESPNPNVYVDKQGAVLTKSDLDSLIRRLWLDEHADYDKGDWWIVCHPNTHHVIHDFDASYRRIGKPDKYIGFHVDEFHAKVGKTFPILSERFMRPEVLLVVNLDAFTYGYHANDLLERRELPTQGRYQRWLISFQAYGLVARNPRANIGMMYGLPQ
ncbi:MAG: DUF5309 family protein [Thermodesulfobacteriota bacterium]